KAIEREVRRIRCGAGHLARAVDAVHPDAEDRAARGCDHGSIPAIVCRVLLVDRLASLAMKAWPATVNDSWTAASAADRKAPELAVAPVRIASASRARHGIVPTPPTATRAISIVPSSITSAAAAEGSGNSH